MMTETIDRLFLELSQFTSAKTARELHLEKRVVALEQRVIADEGDSAQGVDVEKALQIVDLLRGQDAGADEVAAPAAGEGTDG